jgi:hypothetical protein
MLYMTLRLGNIPICKFGSDMSTWVILGGNPADFPQFRVEERKTKAEIMQEYIHRRNLMILDTYNFETKNVEEIADKFEITQNVVHNVLGIRNEGRSIRIVEHYLQSKRLKRDIDEEEIKDEIALKFHITINRLNQIIKTEALKKKWNALKADRMVAWKRSQDGFKVY